MKKILVVFFVLMLSACTKQKEAVKINDPVKITYQVKQNQHFKEKEKIDFKTLISGDYDSVEFSKEDLSVGQHHVVATMKKQASIEKVSIQYFIDKEVIIEKPKPIEETKPIEKPKPVEQPKPVEKPKPVEQPKPVENPATVSFSYPDSQLATMRTDKLTLVNKKYRLDPNFVPKNLVVIPKQYATYEGMMIDKEFYQQFLVMRKDASVQGLNLRLNSCYRSYSSQKSIYSRYLQNNTQAVVDTFSARPGHSEHQLGLACDFASGNNTLGNFTGTKEAAWMAKNAHKYGFILRYPKGQFETTGYAYESWHFRYLGVEVATKVFNSGLTFEQYYESNLR